MPCHLPMLMKIILNKAKRPEIQEENTKIKRKKTHATYQLLLLWA